MRLKNARIVTRQHPFGRFLSRHCDVDLQQLLDSTVPPVNLEVMQTFRSVIFKYKRKAREHLEYQLPGLSLIQI